MNPRRGYPFHPVKAAGALLLSSGVFGGWLLANTAPTLAAPVINPLSSGLLAGATTLSGTATPNSSVQVFNGTTSLEVTPVGADGNWRLNTNLKPGPATLFARALDGDTRFIDSNKLNLTVGALSADPQASLEGISINEPRVDVNAFLPNAPFQLTGTGVAGETLAVFDGATKIGDAMVSADGAWSFTVTPSSAGDHDYSVRKSGSASGPVVTLNIAQAGANEAACPCKLRFILVNAAAQDARITLAGSSAVPKSVTSSVIFKGQTVREIAYPALPAGSFAFTVAQSGFESVRGNAVPPKNRAITVYLDPQK